jgi:HSP20 family protein
MNALTLLNNFEREFARPFFTAPARRAWVNDFSHVTETLSSELTYNEKEAGWTLTVEVPGTTKESLKVDFDEGHLRIAGEKTKGVNKGKFEVRYGMPEGVDEEKMEAQFEDGILTVQMPKLEKKTAKAITIK